MNQQIAALATDEEHIVMWDIDAILSDYKDHAYIEVDTELLIPKTWLTIDEQYALTTNIKTPLILFELPDEKLYIADGNHRLFRAASEHVQKMKVFIIPQERHLSYLYRCSTEDYYNVVGALMNEGIFINNFSHN